MAELDIKPGYKGLERPLHDYDLERHASEVRQLNDDFNNRKNSRVPITFYTDESFWLRISGYSFRQFYTDPRIHLETQLVAKAWACNNIPDDSVPGLPEKWVIPVQYWMEENDFFGCEILMQEDNFAWSKPLAMTKETVLGHIRGIDAKERLPKCRAWQLYTRMREIADGKCFLGRPIEVRPAGTAVGITHGIFTKACEVWGSERLCVDMAEDPAFAEALINAVTDKTIEKLKAGRAFMQTAFHETPGDLFLFADDSIHMISKKMYDDMVLPCHEKLYAHFAGDGRRGIHLCGRAEQHFETLYRKLNVTYIDGPGPFVDHAKYLEEFGPDFSFTGRLNTTTECFGDEPAIRDMIVRLMTPGAKQPGRFSLLGYVQRDSRLDAVRLIYSLIKQYGKIG